MRIARAIAGVGLVVVPIGCTSLLGDFTQSNGKGPESDASTTDAPGSSPEATTADTMQLGAMDAGDGEASVALRQLTCDPITSPTTLAGYPVGDSGSPVQHIFVEGTSSNEARIIAAVGGPNINNEIDIYSVQDHGSVSGHSTIAGVGIANEHAVSGTMTILAQNYMTSQEVLYQLPESQEQYDASGPPTDVFSFPPGQGNNGGNQNNTFVQIEPNDFYVLASYPDKTSNYDLAFWRNGVWTTLAKQMTQYGLNDPLLPTSNAVYFFGSAGSGGGPTALNEYTLPLSAPDSGTASLTTRVVTDTSDPAAVIGGTLTSSGSYSLAFAEIPGQTIQVRLGSVAASDLPTFSLSSLPALPFGGGIDQLPFNNGGARWIADGAYFAMLGGGGTGGPNTDTGLNFYVATLDGQWLINIGGNGKNLLSGQTILNSAFDLQQAFSSALLGFHIAWEQLSSDSTSYVIYYAQLNCHT